MKTEQKPEAWIVYTDGGSHTFRTEAEAQYERDEFERHMELAGQAVVHEFAEPLFTRRSGPVRYRIRPTEVVEAYRFNASGGAVPRWVTEEFEAGRIKLYDGSVPWLFISSLVGDLRVNIGDWVVRVDGRILCTQTNEYFVKHYEVYHAA